MEQNVSMIKILLIFYLLIGSSLTQPLLNKQWIKIVDENRLIKHIVGLITMIILVSLCSNNDMSVFNILLYSLIGYTWFIFSTKINIQINIVIILLILFAYFYERNVSNKIHLIENDKVLDKQQKNILIYDHQKKKSYIFIGLFICTLAGMSIYSHKKEIQYGGGYSLANFLLY